MGGESGLPRWQIVAVAALVPALGAWPRPRERHWQRLEILNPLQFTATDEP
jgi:hypothetical protein